ncbi:MULTISPECIES: S24 family peptidase [Pseudomonadota]|jgi:bacteriophage CI repressor helix-turn-helix domain|uniref:Repressor protein CI n=1 Tax=Myoviridae sp. ctT1Q6 TaxID=2823546 RepID=A0A8S5LFM7_9CAUD|nr:MULTISPECIES: S24 family peptidase [Pseudomonadota]DAD68750.1 MAG TPA: repressor protein CI [Myoviridae sp. ctT1Q6]DAO77179.1 MAG TPA: Repressor protein CI [Caudoviricetes sp.]
MEFVDFLYRLKQALDFKQDKDVADFLGLSEKAFSARKNRNSIPERHLRAAAAMHPNLHLDVDYILTGSRIHSSLGNLGHNQNTFMKEVVAHIHTRLNLGIDEISEELGIEKERFQRILEGEIDPPLLVLERLVTKFGIDAQWLLTGKSYSNKQNVESATDDDYDFIPMYDVEVSAGNGAAAYGVTEPAMHLAFRKDWLKSRGLYAKDLNCVIARGDSMEPTISSKDTLLVDTSKTNPRDGHIYVIRSGETLWVKRIQKQIDGSLLLISDNDTYPPMSLMLADHPDIQVIGQVVQISKDLN